MLLLQRVIALRRIFADDEVFCMFCSFQNLNFGVENGCTS